MLSRTLSAAAAMLVLASCCHALGTATGNPGEIPFTSPVKDGDTALALNTHSLAPVEGELKMIAAAGFTIIRTDVSWAEMESTKGVYNFTATDNYVAALAVHGITWVAIFGASNPLYDQGVDVHTAGGIAAYGNWCAATALRYRSQVQAGVLLLELVNEPNLGVYGDNASLYAQLVATAAIAVKSAAPAAEVIGPASANIDMSWLTSIFEAGALNHLTQVTVHPYRSNSPETAFADFVALRSLVDEYSPVASGRRLAINSGEWGYSSKANPSTGLDEVSHAKIVARQLLVTIASQVGFSVYYDWRDDDGAMGLVRLPLHAGRAPPYDAKPAYNASAVLAAALHGFIFVERLHVFQSGQNTEDDWVLLFRQPRGSSASNHTRYEVPWAKFSGLLRLPIAGLGFAASALHTGYKRVTILTLELKHCGVCILIRVLYIFTTIYIHTYR